MSALLSAGDWILIAGYFLLLVWLGWSKGWLRTDEESYLLSGRKISLVAFVATLVSTWYGGILGVGEYSYQFGVSQWLILGFPYYVFSALFAILLAGRIRRNRALSIPEAIGNCYGDRAGRLSALPIFILVSPAPYILMLAVLFQFMIGGEGPFLLYAVLVAVFSAIYVTVGGFGAVVRTDMLQLILMYSGFGLLLFYALQSIGTPATLWESLPDTHRDPTGGHSIQYLLVWFFIALWTFVDPGFHQRAAAAKSPETARKGIFVSILFWALFDFLTLFCGLYGWALLQGTLEDPLLVYPALADLLLPAGLKGLFYIALLATIMSTLDSFLFLSGQTIGRDYLSRYLPTADRNRLTRFGIFFSAIVAIALIVIYPSVIDLWYIIGSVFIPGLLLPVLGIYIPLFRMDSGLVTLSLIGVTGLSLFWLIMGTLSLPEPYSYAYLGIEPFYPGLLTALLIWLVDKARRSRRNRP